MRDANFALDFPGGLLIGGAKASALWTTSSAIRGYLPAAGKPAALSGNATDPRSTSAGVLGGQQVAAKLNVGILDAPTDYVFVRCVTGALIGVSVGDVIAMADEAMSTGSPPAGLSFSDLNGALTVFNENYDECRDARCLAPPIGIPPPPLPSPTPHLRRPVSSRRPTLPRL